MEFFEAPAFTRYLDQYLTDDELAAVQWLLMANPEAGDVMPGTGGFRKLRWRDQRRGKGRRGGMRVIYYHLTSDFQIWLAAVYDKDEAVDLSPKDKRSLHAAISKELKTREERRGWRKKSPKRAG